MTVEIDGAHGEGGGQLLRTAVALAAITGSATRVHDVRAGRERPGLAPQHLAAVRAVAGLCGAEVEGLALRSRTVRFSPRALQGGEHTFDIGTAGSITLVLQALLPVMIAARQPVIVTVIGGTDVRQAPPADYLAHVLLPLLARMGVGARMEILRRGYYPRGGGAVRLTIDPGALRPLVLDAPGSLVAIEGHAHVANLPGHIAERMRAAALAHLAGTRGCAPRLEAAMLPASDATGRGGAIAAWCRTDNTVLGAGRVAELGVRAETLGDAVGGALARDLAAGATVDIHAADQLLVYFALCGAGAYRVRELTAHTRTAMWLIEQFLPIRFETTATAGLTRVAVVPR